MRSARSSARLLEERGVTWVTAALLLALLLGGYLSWVWIPAWIVHYEAKQVVRDYCNQAVKNPNDAELVENMVHKLRVLDERAVVGDDGRVTKIPVIDVAPTDIVWERSAETATLHVAFDYVRPIRYPIIDRSTETVFQIDVTMDISRPDWGPVR
jgi:hypothetical protein